MTSTTWVTAHWNPSFLADFSWISCLRNRSKNVNLPIFAVLNMPKHAIDEENRTVVTRTVITCLRWLPNTVWKYTKSNGLFQKKSKSNWWHGWGRHGVSKGIEEHGNSRGQLKKKWNFHRSVHKKAHAELLGGNQKNVWLFGLIYIIHLPIPKTFFNFLKICPQKFFNFPKICGAEEWTYLNSSHKFIQCNSFLKCTCDIG